MKAGESVRAGMRCEVCGDRGDTELAQCSGCLQAWYCSRDCQRRHWREHKRDCRPCRVAAVPGKGLGLLATRSIKQGELILRENPTLIKHHKYPSLEQQFSRLNKSVQGEILKLHHDNTGDTLDRRINQIFLANACDIVDNKGFALYPTIPRMNHSCCPNVVWSYLETDPMIKEVRALKNIVKDEELCPNYIDSFENVFAPSAHRRKVLSKRWKFQCQCLVCSFPKDKQTENDNLRKELQRVHSSIPHLMSTWDLEGALAAAQNKIFLLKKISDQMITVMPSALLELYEINRIALARGYKVEEMKNLVEEAFKLSARMGDSFVKIFHQKINQIEEECRQLE